MSIENTLERIATALETIAKRPGPNVLGTIVADVAKEMTTTGSKTIDAELVKDDAEAEAAAKKKADEERMAAAQVNADKLKAQKAEAAAAKKKAEDEAAAAAAAAKAAEDAKKSKHTLDDVRAALKAYRDLEGSAAMLEMLKKYGAEALKDIDPANYDALMVDITA